MYKKQTLCKSQKRGFTLVELLVVVSIIGLIATVVSYNLESARMKARDAKRMQDVDTIIKALFLYEAQTGRKMGPGSGCGDNGNGFGWFWGDVATNPSVANYPKSIARCLRDAGATEGIIQDPLQTSTSNSSGGFTYMIGYPGSPNPPAPGIDCIPGKTRYVYAKLEGRAQSGTALNTTCEPEWDSNGSNAGMNYFKKFE